MAAMKALLHSTTNSGRTTRSSRDVGAASVVIEILR
jgi:hypothetical protein